MRAKIIAGNWKMHNTIDESLALVKTIHHNFSPPENVNIIVSPSFIALDAIADFLKTSYISVAAQNLSSEEKGAFTGEISASMLKDIGVEYVIIGHSERRHCFHETDETINKKIKIALKHQLIPIICVGETLNEREANLTQEIITKQINEGLRECPFEQIIIAYEPVWAIGTGKTATPKQAEAVHQFIRQLIQEIAGNEIADKIPILYGGSVKPSNSRELLKQENIDGALVGGASLKANDFIEIIRHGHAS